MLNREAYDETDYQIGRAEGLITALEELAEKSAFLSSSDPGAHAITTLLVMLRETLTKVAECHHAEWEAAKAPKAA